MSVIGDYKGIDNRDIRPLRGGAAGKAPASGGGKPMVFSVEEFRNGINIGSPDGAGTKTPGSDPLAEGEKTSPEDALPRPYRGRSAVPKSYLAARSGGGLSEEQQIAKLQKIRESAQEYEGMLMNELIKSMRQNPLTKTPGSDTYSEIAEKPFTAALTAAGGLGLADRIVEDVARQEGLTETLERHPEIMGPNWNPKISPSRMYKPVNREDPEPTVFRRAPDLKEGAGDGAPDPPKGS
ncbi:MAG: hypothetical protein LBR53_11850 [Deltaproteobacteria bacterium]|jgi:Rod binding domain-containing protein|nr:hypothetical protein [Deltaproteobacteria bacterium]